MVLLKSLECIQCHDRCYPYITPEKQPVLVRGCAFCSRLFCGKCTRTGINVQCPSPEPQSYYGGPKCILQDSSPHYAAAIAYFDKFAPAEEMRLLSLQRWSPLYCRVCSSRKRANSRGRMFCPYCYPENCAPKDCKEMGSSAETQIVCELNELLTNDDRKAVTPKVIDLVRRVCNLCGDPVKEGIITDSGRITCAYCRGSKPSYNIWYIECAFYFDVFLQYLPDVDDLKLLTYSKWTPLKCKCSVVLSEIEENLPILDKNLHKILCQKCTDEENSSENRENFIKLHILVDIIKEFRQYFKNNGIDCETNENLEDVIPLATLPESYLEEQLLEVTTLICNLKTTIPDTPRCQCGRYEAIEKMKNCNTCHINAICPYCLVQEHWTHQITDTMPELLVEVVNNESDKIKRKLKKWRVRLEQTNTKGKEVFGKLVTVYETLFLKSLKSKDPTELHNLIIHSDFSNVDDLLMDIMTSNYKTFEKIEEFCTALDELSQSSIERDSPGDSQKGT